MMEKGWNDIAQRRPGQAFRENKLPLFWRQPPGIILHHTGAGVLKRAKQWNVTPDEAAVRVYEKIMDYSGHYVVGESGIYQIVPETHQAWHTASPKLSAWNKDEFQWWVRRWPYADTPRDVVPGSSVQGWRPNHLIGIEIVSVPAGETFSEATYRNLEALLRNIAGRYGWPLDRLHVIGHADADPARRSLTDGSAPWDPPTHLEWSRVWLDDVVSPNQQPKDEGRHFDPFGSSWPRPPHWSPRR